MKLYANIRNSKGKREGVGDDTAIIIELSHGNKIIGTVGLYAVKTAVGLKDIGHRVVWKSDSLPVVGQIITEDVRYDKVKPPCYDFDCPSGLSVPHSKDDCTKGKQQKGEYICRWCKNGEHIECEADMCQCKHL